MARPRKQHDEQRSERFTVRYTVAERVFLEQQAATAALPVAELLRRRSLAQPVRPPRARIDAALLAELNRCGVNLNQIARNLNSGRTERHELDVLMAELRGVIGKLAAGSVAGVDEDDEAGEEPDDGPLVAQPGEARRGA